MKQYKFQYQSTPSFVQELEAFRAEHPMANHVLFGVYSDTLDRRIVGEACDAIERVFPEAEYYGCSTDYLLGRTKQKELN